MLHAVTIFLSAFLLFQVQPIVARMILPWFGGSAAVWTACMLFFQVLLVGGYLYAHWSARRLAPRTQAMLHIVLLAVACTALPLTLSAGWKPAGGADPTLAIVALLGASVGLPYFLLSTTSPLVQSWYARAAAGAVPYRLFALSNAGSMLALVSYPVVVEPVLPTHWQSLGWSAGFAVFAALAAALAWRSRHLAREPQAGEDAAAGAPPTRADYSLWTLLPACASVLLLAFTSQLSQNVAPIPFLWVLPLALYLLSFILCFEGRGWYRRHLFLPLAAAGIIAVALTLTTEYRNPKLGLMVPLYCATLFVACMACHGELARLKPHPRHLTAYFLMVSIGGALGGLFVGFVAPHVFPDLYELPVGMVATAAAVVAVLARERRTVARRAFRFSFGAAGVFTGALAVGLVWNYAALAREARVAVRNFYAGLHVTESGAGESAMRRLNHGTIMHGKQFRSSERRRWPTSYYGEGSGVGLAIAARQAAGPVRVGVVGLGTGTLAAYGRAGDVFRIYEINPQVVALARDEFSFLADSRAQHEIVLGDARLALEAEAPQRFDVLAIDAFSSDSIPVHLLTAEAFAAYLRHLAPEGLLAVHISNRFLDLKPVVLEAAARYGRTARVVESDGDDDRGTSSSTWVLIAAGPGAFERAPLAGAARPLESERRVPLWTDDYSDVFAILK